TLIAVTVDGLALDILEDEVRLAVVRHAAIEQARDVRMAQRGEDLPLGPEAPSIPLRGQAGPQQLAGSALLRLAVRALGEHHATHAAAPDLIEKSPRTHASPLLPCFLFAVLCDDRRRKSRGRRFQEP